MIGRYRKSPSALVKKIHSSPVFPRNLSSLIVESDPWTAHWSARPRRPLPPVTRIRAPTSAVCEEEELAFSGILGNARLQTEKLDACVWFGAK